MANYNLETETTVHVKGMTVGDSPETGGGSPLNAFHMKIGPATEIYYKPMLDELFIVSPKESVLETNAFGSIYRSLLISDDGEVIFIFPINYIFRRIVFCSDVPSDAIRKDLSEISGGDLFLYEAFNLDMLG